MKTMRRWQLGCLAALGLSVAGLTGCQTNTAGMTLPSPHYLQHPPQYFVPGPSFPLTRELASMEAQAQTPVPGVPLPPAPLPPQVPQLPQAPQAPAPAPMPPPPPPG